MEAEYAESVGRLEVHLLGNVAVKLNGQPVPGFDSPRLQRLLAQMSTEGGISRSRLAFELWPDSTETQARGNLRKLLHDLRQVLPGAGSFIDFGPQVLRWKPGPQVVVDVLVFRAAIARGDLVFAASAYGGDLLPASYDDWVLDERQRLRSQALDAFLHLASESLQAGRYPDSVAWARRALAIDELSETAYRLQIQAFAGRGDRAEGVRTYHRCLELLQRELGVEPRPETRAAYESLLTSGQRPAAPTPPASNERLVGRAAELAMAMDAWRRASQGGTLLLLIEGEAGIGKTRLAEELAQTVGADGFPVARTRCYQAAGSPPWTPVVDWIRTEPLRAWIDRLEEPWLIELSRLLPELHAPAPGAETDFHTETARQRLLDALTRAMFAGGRPLLLVIDDLQWCDRETLELIGYLLRGGPPLLIAGTVRSDEVEEHHPLTSLVRSIASDGKLAPLRLGPLDEADTARLAESIAGSKLQRDALEKLWRATEGMPLFVVEAVRSGSATSLTPTIRAVISARLAQLSPPARRLAEVAATVGRSFTFAVLAKATAMDEDQLVDALDELWRRRIVRETAGAYDFSHERIREVAYDAIAPALRRRLHGKVAGALAGDQTLAGLVAAHYAEAGLPERAVDAYLAAGRRAIEVFSLEDAVDAFRRGLALLEQLPAGRRRDEAELALRTALGVPLVAREGYGSDTVQETYQRAMVLCERLGLQVHPEVLRGLGLASLMSCRFDRSDRYARALLLQRGDDPTAATEGHYLLGVGAFWRGDALGSEENLRLAVSSFSSESAGQHLHRYAQDPKAVCLIRLALTLLWTGKVDSSRRLADEALEYGLSLGHPTTEGYLRMYTSMLAAERESWERLDAELSAGEAVWSGQGLGYFSAVGGLLRAWYAIQTGEHEDAVARLAQQVDRWRTQAQTLHFTYGLALLARARLRAGEVEDGLRTTAEGLRWSADHDQGYLVAEFHRLEGELLALSGWNPQAERALHEAVRVASSQGNWWLAVRPAASLARRDFRTAPSLQEVLGRCEAGEDVPALRRASDLAKSLKSA